ncbi:AAA family ATPase [Glutamicibacter sp. AOP12-B1-11]|uniref:AAA family ATPase n=1 Tax=Glutamicibacter sp. AOP12-B1-11 TaxID=3457725 RepID=UPI004034E000
MRSTPITMTDEFDDALSRLHSGKNLFLTGKAGTGKSTLIRTYLEQTQRASLVAAPTGIAALNVEGYTIHRLFGFHSGTTVEQVRSSEYYPGRFAKVLKRLETLIIDEASMVRADLFDCLVEALTRFGPKPGHRFGGIQLVMVGDLYQLPPVVLEPESEYFSTVYESPFFFSANTFETSEFPVVELTTVFRQLGDDRLVSLLNSVRDGSLTPESQQALNQQVRSGFTPPLDERWLTLTTTNRIAGARNKRMLEKLDAPLHTSEAKITGDITGFEPLADKKLQFKDGAQVMMLTNDPADRWVNGTIAEVIATSTTDAGHEVAVKLPSGTTAIVTAHKWHVTRPEFSDGTIKHESVGSFVQLPFKLSWAITIHKSQGQTLDKCVVDLAGGTFADGQLYVGLSRCTNLEGLVLTQPIQPKDLKVNQRIRRYLRSKGTEIHSTGTAYVGVCTVGEPSRLSRPRPVEIAIITDAGEEISTLINPERDLGTAWTDYDIAASEILLAPRLHEAWNALSPFLAGRTPVGFNIDSTLYDIDYELKRGGHLAEIPLGNDAQDLRKTQLLQEFYGRTAIGQARAARDSDLQNTHRTSHDVFPDSTGEPGYLMPRAGSSEVVEFLVASDEQLEYSLANFLASKATVAVHEASSAAVLAGVDKIAGSALMQDSQKLMKPIHEIAVAGAGICFTGSARDLQGKPISRTALEDIAVAHGMVPQANVTKSKCRMLVSAETGTQSGKAKSAQKFGIPIFSVDQYLHHVSGTMSESTDGAVESRTVRIRPVPVPMRQQTDCAPEFHDDPDIVTEIEQNSLHESAAVFASHTTPLVDNFQGSTIRSTGLDSDQANYDRARAESAQKQPYSMTAARTPMLKKSKCFHLVMLSLTLGLLIILPLCFAGFAVAFPKADSILFASFGVSALAGVVSLIFWIVVSINRMLKRNHQQ